MDLHDGSDSLTLLVSWRFIMYEKYFNKLREECLIRNRSSRTTDTYINNIRHFMKWTGYKSMEDLSLQDARSFILEKRNSGLSSATCNFYNSSICFLSPTYKSHHQLYEMFQDIHRIFSNSLRLTVLAYKLLLHLLPSA